ncbi:unnamed protein product [Nippostrongylus brasiliensis]|uniref:Uncharacterized protein n=1 Tax=Nippostrongylus brasiliensis TaxID=27835 RepID=A0A0N4XMW4_NIPBR|nr:unnamed protein product [Nippostrongylus brasiliensis]
MSLERRETKSKKQKDLFGSFAGWLDRVALPPSLALLQLPLTNKGTYKKRRTEEKCDEELANHRYGIAIARDQFECSGGEDGGSDVIGGGGVGFG